MATIEWATIRNPNNKYLTAHMQTALYMYLAILNDSDYLSGLIKLNKQIKCTMFMNHADEASQKTYPKTTKTNTNNKLLFSICCITTPT